MRLDKREDCFLLLRRFGAAAAVTALLALLSSAPLFSQIETDWVRTSGPTGGMIDTIEMDPDNPLVLYAGGEGGLVYKTTNGGDNWSGVPTDAFLLDPPEHIYNILIPTGPLADGAQVIYAVAGKLHRSADKGDNWETDTLPRGAISRVALAPDDPLCLVASDNWMGRDPGAPETETDYGYIYLTEDGGESWTDITRDPLPTDLPLTGVGALAFGVDKNDIWVGTARQARDGDSGHLYHTTDQGANWTFIEISHQPDNSDISSIFIDPTSPGTVYVGLINAHNEDFNSLTDWYFVKTTNGGASWQRIRLPRECRAGHATYIVQVNILGKFPPDPYLYVATGMEVWKSSDGITWTELTPPDLSGDMYDMAVDPGNPADPQGGGSTLYLARRSYGVSRSSDAGVNWTYINQGLNNVSVSLLAAPVGTGETENGTLYAASSFGVGSSMTTDRGDNWRRTMEGIDHLWTDEVMVSPHDSRKVWQVADVGNIYETLDGGGVWEKIVDTNGGGFRYGSIYAMATAPSNPDVIYALKNGFGIYKSTDRGFTWSFLHQSEVDYSYTLAVHPTKDPVVYSGTTPKQFQDTAMVRKSTDGGATWNTMQKFGHVKGVTSVVIDPRDPDQNVFAGVAADTGRVWSSNDGGQNWQEPNTLFNFTNVHVLAADPTQPLVAYAGIWGGGTYKTTDGGQKWKRLTNDPTVSASAILPDPRIPSIITLADRTAPRIFKTMNNGATWMTLADFGADYRRVMAAAMAPSKPDLIYISLLGRSGPFDGGVFSNLRGFYMPAGKLPRVPLALTVDPLDPFKVYAVLHGYGVYKTTNGGVVWSEISDAAGNLPQSPKVGFNGLVIDPSDPRRLYLFGGCDVDYRLSHGGALPSVMNTVYRSTDEGVTWTNLDNGDLGAQTDAIKGLAIASAGANRVLTIGSLKGVWRSDNDGSSWMSSMSGLGYKQTAGIALSSDGARFYCPTLGGGIYIGTVDAVSHAVSWDSPDSLKVPIYHVQLAMPPTGSPTLYASAYPGGMFKSVDAGLTWSECNFGLPSFKIDDPNRQGYYAFALAASAPEVIYLGMYGIGVYKSSDGAGTWRPVNGADQLMQGRPITSLLVSRSDENTVYVGTEEGVYRTRDGGGSWSLYNPSALSPEIILPGGHSASTRPDLTAYQKYPIIGAKDAVPQRILKSPGVYGWSTSLEINRPPLFVGQPMLDVRVLAMDTLGTLYAGTRGYEVYSNTAEYGGWKQLGPFGNFGTYWPIWNDRPLYQYTSVLFDKTDPNLVYIGTFPAGIYKSTDGGIVWKESNVGWPIDGVFCLVFRPGDPSTIYAGSYNGVNRSTDAGVHWHRWNEGWPDQQWVFWIDFDPRNPQIMYACSKDGSNEGTGIVNPDGTSLHGTVMKSTDGGKSWFEITTGLTRDQEFYKILVNQENGNVLYLATERKGVYISRNAGGSWEPWNEGLTNLFAGTNKNNVTNTMVFSPDGRYLYLATAGTGVFRRDVHPELKRPSERLKRLREQMPRRRVRPLRR